MSTKSKIRYAIIQQDESGKETMFKIPLAALYYNSGIVSCIDEMRIDVRMEKLIEKVYQDDDIVEQMIFSTTDRIDYVRWVREACRVKSKI